MLQETRVYGVGANVLRTDVGLLSAAAKNTTHRLKLENSCSS